MNYNKLSDILIEMEAVKEEMDYARADNDDAEYHRLLDVFNVLESDRNAMMKNTDE